MSKVKVLVSDYISDEGIKILEKENIEVTYDYKLSREEFLNIVGEYDGIIVRSFTQLDKEALDKAEKLKVIGRAGTGYDNIDLEEASKKVLLSLILQMEIQSLQQNIQWPFYLPCPAMYHRLARPYLMVSGIGKSITVLN